MIDKFNGIFYLVVFVVHFLGYAFYAYRCIFATQSFLDQYAMDKTGAIMIAPVLSIAYWSKKDWVAKMHLYA